MSWLIVVNNVLWTVCVSMETEVIYPTILQLEQNNIKDVPIVIIASDRPHYLFR